MPRQVNHEERQREIIFAVWAVIAGQGIEAVTMRSVASAANVSVGRIQHYFPSKEELVYTACEAMIGGAHGQYQKQTDDREPLAALRHIARSGIPFSPATRIAVAVWYSFVARSIADSRIANLLRETRQGTFREVVRQLEGAQAHGLMARDTDLAGTARRFLLLAAGLSQATLIGEITPDAALEEIEQELQRLHT